MNRILDPRALAGVDVRWEAGLNEDTVADWARLVAADPTSSPFVSPRWVVPWLHHCGDGATPALLTVWSANEMVGIAPLMDVTKSGTRRLCGAAQRDSDHWNVVALPDMRAAVARAVAREIAARRDRWDIVHLDHLPAGSPLERELRNTGLRVASVATTPCPVLPLPPTFEDYLVSLPKKRRQSIRRSLKRLEAGEVWIRSVDDAADLERTLVRWQAMRVEQYRQRRTRINPIHVSDGYRAFLVAALSEMTCRGEARVQSVEHDGVVVGVYVTLYDSRAAYAYQGGYDIAVASLGIGKIVDALVIQTGIADGRRALDFGRGREPYKYWYGACDQEAVALLCGHTGARSSLAYGSRSALLRLGGAVRALRRRG